MKEVTIDGKLICSPPLCGMTDCSRCTSDGNSDLICPEYYYCDEYLGKFCLPYYDYYLETMIIKSILNGYILQAKVGPSKNGLVPGINDTLSITIDNLIVDVDYSIQINPLDLGIFQINLCILQELEITNMKAHFTYSPLNLNLEATLDLPRVIFIDSGVKKASENTKGNSQLLFLIFIITIIGMILGGGISALWAALPESQYAYYLIYLNIDYVHQVQLYLQSMSNYDFLAGSDSKTDDMRMMDPALKTSLPNRFYVLDYSPDFIPNTDQVFIQIFVLLGGALFASIILRYVRFPRQLFLLQKTLDLLLRFLKWNGLLRQVLTYTLPLSTAAFVQIYNSIFGKQTSFFPLASAVLTLVILVWALAKMYSLIQNPPSDRHQRAIYTKLYGTLWEDLNIDQLFSKYYYWLTALRGLVLAYVCVFCDMYPYIQIFVVLFYQVGVVGLFVRNLITLRPVFAEKNLNKIMFIEEALLLIMKTFILAFLFMRDSATNNTIIIMGWMIVLPGASVQIIQIGYSIYTQIQNRKKIYRMFQSASNFLKRKQKMKRIKRTHRFVHINFDRDLNVRENAKITSIV